MELELPEKALRLMVVLQTAGEISGRTKMQKVVFLVQREIDVQGTPEKFKFRPYLYGPYSDDLDRWLQLLTALGMIRESSFKFHHQGMKATGYSYRLTVNGRKALEAVHINALTTAESRTLVRRYSRMGLDKLLRYVYKTYPQMATRSALSGFD